MQDGKSITNLPIQSSRIFLNSSQPIAATNFAPSHIACAAARAASRVFVYVYTTICLPLS